MDKETVDNLLAGGIITGVITYILNLFMKRSDKADEMEKRVAALEIATVDIKYIKEKQANVDQKIDQILEMLTDVRIQINAPKRRSKQSENIDG